MGKTIRGRKGKKKVWGNRDRKKEWFPRGGSFPPSQTFSSGKDYNRKRDRKLPGDWND